MQNYINKLRMKAVFTEYILYLCILKNDCLMYQFITITTINYNQLI